VRIERLDIAIGNIGTLARLEYIRVMFAWRHIFVDIHVRVNMLLEARLCRKSALAAINDARIGLGVRVSDSVSFEPRVARRLRFVHAAAFPQALEFLTRLLGVDVDLLQVLHERIARLNVVAFAPHAPFALVQRVVVFVARCALFEAQIEQA